MEPCWGSGPPGSARFLAGLAIALAGRGGLLGGGGAFGGGAGRGGLTPQLAPLLARHLRVGLAPAASRLVAAAGLLVNRRPGPALRFVLGDASLLVALFDVFG